MRCIFRHLSSHLHRVELKFQQMYRLYLTDVTVLRQYIYPNSDKSFIRQNVNPIVIRES